MSVRGVSDGFVLHTRTYRESSLLVTLFTETVGLVPVVAKAARGKRGHGLLPFRRLRLRWVGRTALMTLTGYELIEAHAVTGRGLGAGLYLNELLVRLIREHEPIPGLYVGYERALLELAAGRVHLEAPLRQFEKTLLDELGYGIDFYHDANTGRTVQADLQYRFDPEVGFSASQQGIPGAHLLAIGEDNFLSPEVRRSAKRLLRSALRPHLGHKPLASRAFFAGSASHAATGSKR